jgi:hypothetical protein
VIHPLHPDYDAGSGRQILLTADWEMLEMWTPGSAVGARDYRPGGGGGGGVEGRSAEQLKEDEQFPLLFEGSSFYHSSPIVHDVGGDGVADAILGDYDGNVHVVGLDFEPGGGGGGGRRRTRAYRRIAIPRLFVRKSWYEVAINRTREDLAMAMALDANNANNATAVGNRTKKWEEFEPYHTYFASASGDEKWRGKADEDALRGVSGNVLNMDVDSARSLAERRRRGVSGSSRGGGRNDGGGEEVGGGVTTGGGGDGDGDVDVEGGGVHRRLQEEVVGNVDAGREDEQHEVGGGEVDADREKREGGGNPATADADGDIREGVGNEEVDANRDEHEGVDSDVEKGWVGQVGGARDASDEGVERNDAGADTGDAPKRYLDDYMSSEKGLFGDEGLFDDAIGAPPDGADSAEEYTGNLGDDAYLEHEPKGDIVDSTEVGRATDDFYGDRRVDDYYGRRSGYIPETPEGWDSYEQWQDAKNKYYHDSNYIRLPPHLLSTCSLVELQRSYGYGSSSAKPEDKIDELVLCAVSYYFDEDECRDPSKGQGKSFGKHANADGGDETEELRGRYMASAVMAYNLK